jgi:hypothetical protein
MVVLQELCFLVRDHNVWNIEEGWEEGWSIDQAIPQFSEESLLCENQHFVTQCF